MGTGVEAESEAFSVGKHLVRGTQVRAFRSRYFQDLFMMPDQHVVVTPFPLFGEADLFAP